MNYFFVVAFSENYIQTQFPSAHSYGSWEGVGKWECSVFLRDPNTKVAYHIYILLLLLLVLVVVVVVVVIVVAAAVVVAVVVAAAVVIAVSPSS